MIQSEADVRAGTVRRQPQLAREGEESVSPPSLSDVICPDLDQQLEVIETQAALTIEDSAEREAVATRIAIDRALQQIRAAYPVLTEADLDALRAELERGR